MDYLNIVMPIKELGNEVILYNINKDKIYANSRKYYDDNVDYILKRMAEYYKENKEKKLLYNMASLSM